MEKGEKGIGCIVIVIIIIIFLQVVLVNVFQDACDILWFSRQYKLVTVATHDVVHCIQSVKKKECAVGLRLISNSTVRSPSQAY